MRFGGLVLAALALSVFQASADVPADCMQLKNPALTNSSCTVFINTGQGSNHERSVAHFHRGTALDMTGNLDGAIIDLTRAIELDPTWAPPFNNRARALVGKGEHVHAIADYDRALELNPGDATGYVNRALAYLKMKDDDHALSDLLKGVELNPRNAFAVFNIGAIYEAKGDRKNAAAAYRQALVLVPGNQNVLDSLERVGAEP
jgi:tetratricopeptide (TPR) repeat protein